MKIQIQIQIPIQIQIQMQMQIFQQEEEQENVDLISIPMKKEDRYGKIVASGILEVKYIVFYDEIK